MKHGYRTVIFIRLTARRRISNYAVNVSILVNTCMLSEEILDPIDAIDSDNDRNCMY